MFWIGNSFLKPGLHRVTFKIQENFSYFFGSTAQLEFCFMKITWVYFFFEFTIYIKAKKQNDILGFILRASTHTVNLAHFKSPPWNAACCRQFHDNEPLLLLLYDYWIFHANVDLWATAVGRKKNFLFMSVCTCIFLVFFLVFAFCLLLLLLDFVVKTTRTIMWGVYNLWC